MGCDLRKTCFLCWRGPEEGLGRWRSFALFLPICEAHAATGGRSDALPGRRVSCCVTGGIVVIGCI